MALTLPVSVALALALAFVAGKGMDEGSPKLGLVWHGACVTVALCICLPLLRDAGSRSRHIALRALAHGGMLATSLFALAHVHALVALIHWRYAKQLRCVERLAGF